MARQKERTVQELERNTRKLTEIRPSCVLEGIARMRGPGVDDPLDFDELAASREICDICRNHVHDADLLMCSACDRGFHSSCLGPPINASLGVNWLCSECQGATSCLLPASEASLDSSCGIYEEKAMPFVVDSSTDRQKELSKGETLSGSQDTSCLGSKPLVNMEVGVKNTLEQSDEGQLHAKLAADLTDLEKMTKSSLGSAESSEQPPMVEYVRRASLSELEERKSSLGSAESSEQPPMVEYVRRSKRGRPYKPVGGLHPNKRKSVDGTSRQTEKGQQSKPKAAVDEEDELGAKIGKFRVISSIDEKNVRRNLPCLEEPKMVDVERNLEWDGGDRKNAARLLAGNSPEDVLAGEFIDIAAEGRNIEYDHKLTESSPKGSVDSISPVGSVHEASKTINDVEQSVLKSEDDASQDLPRGSLRPNNFRTDDQVCGVGHDDQVCGVGHSNLAASEHTLRGEELSTGVLGKQSVVQSLPAASEHTLREENLNTAVLEKPGVLHSLPAASGHTLREAKAKLRMGVLEKARQGQVKAEYPPVTAEPPKYLEVIGPKPVSGSSDTHSGTKAAEKVHPASPRPETSATLLTPLDISNDAHVVNAVCLLDDASAETPKIRNKVSTDNLKTQQPRQSDEREDVLRNPVSHVKDVDTEEDVEPGSNAAHKVDFLDKQPILDKQSKEQASGDGKRSGEAKPTETGDAKHLGDAKLTATIKSGVEDTGAQSQGGTSGETGIAFTVSAFTASLVPINPGGNQLASHDRIQKKDTPAETSRGVDEIDMGFIAVDDEVIRVCDICGDAGYEECLTICSVCNEGAEHIYCMQPHRSSIPEDGWLCEGCKLKEREEREGNEKKAEEDVPRRECEREGNEKKAEEDVPRRECVRARHIHPSPRKKQIIKGNTRSRLSALLDKGKGGGSAQKAVTPKGTLTTQLSSKRPADDAQTSSAPLMKKQMRENTNMPSSTVTGSTTPRGLTRENSTKAPDSGKVKFLSPTALASCQVGVGGRSFTKSSSFGGSQSLRPSQMAQVANKNRYVLNTIAPSDAVTGCASTPTAKQPPTAPRPPSFHGLAPTPSASGRGGGASAPTPSGSRGGGALKSSEVLPSAGRGGGGAQKSSEPLQSYLLPSRSGHFATTPKGGKEGNSEGNGSQSFGRDTTAQLNTGGGNARGLGASSSGKMTTKWIDSSRPTTQLIETPRPAASFGRQFSAKGDFATSSQPLESPGRPLVGQKMRSQTMDGGKVLNRLSSVSRLSNQLSREAPSRNLEGQAVRGLRQLAKGIDSSETGTPRIGSLSTLSANPLTLTAEPSPESELGRNGGKQIEDPKVSNFSSSGGIGAGNGSKNTPRALQSESAAVEDSKKPSKASTKAAEMKPLVLDDILKGSVGLKWKETDLKWSDATETSLPSAKKTRCYTCKEFGHTAQTCNNKAVAAILSLAEVCTNIEAGSAPTSNSIEDVGGSSLLGQRTADSISPGDLKPGVKLSPTAIVQSSPKAPVKSSIELDSPSQLPDIKCTGSLIAHETSTGLRQERSEEAELEICKISERPAEARRKQLSSPLSLNPEIAIRPDPPVVLSISPAKPAEGFPSKDSAAELGTQRSYCIAKTTQKVSPKLSNDGAQVLLKEQMQGVVLPGPPAGLPPGLPPGPPPGLPPGLPLLNRILEQPLPGPPPGPPPLNRTLDPPLPPGPPHLNRTLELPSPATMMRPMKSPVPWSGQLASPRPNLGPMNQQEPWGKQVGMGVGLQVAVPEPQCLWSGGLEVVSAAVPALYDGINAFTSSFAAPKVRAVTKTLPSRLQLEEVQRLFNADAWPLQFQRRLPTDKEIALYFFPGTESGEAAYMRLLDHMITRDLVLMGQAEGADLLIFPSHLLPKDFHLWKSKHFLWGVYRARRVNPVVKCTPPDPVPSSASATATATATATVPSDQPGTTDGLPYETEKLVSPGAAAVLTSVSEEGEVDMEIDMIGDKELDSQQYNNAVQKPVHDAPSNLSSPPLPHEPPPVQPPPPGVGAPWPQDGVVDTSRTKPDSRFDLPPGFGPGPQKQSVPGFALPDGNLTLSGTSELKPAKTNAPPRFAGRSNVLPQKGPPGFGLSTAQTQVSSEEARDVADNPEVTGSQRAALRRMTSLTTEQRMTGVPEQQSRVGVSSQSPLPVPSPSPRDLRDDSKGGAWLTSHRHSRSKSPSRHKDRILDRVGKSSFNGRESGRGRDSGRGRESGRDREKGQDRERERERWAGEEDKERYRDRGREKERERERGRPEKRERDREREKERDKELDREMERERRRDRWHHRERGRDREKDDRIFYGRDRERSNYSDYKHHSRDRDRERRRSRRYSRSPSQSLSRSRSRSFSTSRPRLQSLSVSPPKRHHSGKSYSRHRSRSHSDSPDSIHGRSWRKPRFSDGPTVSREESQDGVSFSSGRRGTLDRRDASEGDPSNKSRLSVFSREGSFRTRNSARKEASASEPLGNSSSIPFHDFQEDGAETTPLDAVKEEANASSAPYFHEFLPAESADLQVDLQVFDNGVANSPLFPQRRPAAHELLHRKSDRIESSGSWESHEEVKTCPSYEFFPVKGGNAGGSRKSSMNPNLELVLGERDGVSSQETEPQPFFVHLHDPVGSNPEPAHRYVDTNEVHDGTLEFPLVGNMREEPARRPDVGSLNLSLSVPQYRKEGNVWVKIEDAQASLGDEDVNFALTL